jgi:hypothetical protein
VELQQILCQYFALRRLYADSGRHRHKPEAGLDLLRNALEDLRAQQYNLHIPRFLGALAEGLRKTGQFEEALFTVNGAIARDE